jgi:hypothetical protein
MLHPEYPGRSGRLMVIMAIALLVAACGASGSSTPGTTEPSRAAPVSSAFQPIESEAVAPSPSESEAPEPVGGTTSGDIPDNAVFLGYRGKDPGFTIQYVEGWQVTPQADGVVIRDKDSSETVSVVVPQADVAGYVASTDLPFLETQPGFKLIRQDTTKVGGSRYVHLVFHQKSPPDSVTGKLVPQTVDRYYVPGPSGLAIISLATPDGVDNVDAFRQMIKSFAWS